MLRGREEELYPLFLEANQAEWLEHRPWDWLGLNLKSVMEQCNQGHVDLLLCFPFVKIRIIMLSAC